MRRFLNIAALPFVVILFAFPAAAADNGFYIGGAVGQAAIDTGTLGDIEVDDDSTGFKVFTGYRFLTFLSVEGAYADLGTARGEGTAESEISVQGLSLQGVGYIPLGVADIFVKGGIINWETDVSGLIDGIETSTSNDGNDPVYGAGAQVRLGSFCIRGEVEYFDIEDADQLYMISVGASYTF